MQKRKLGKSNLEVSAIGLGIKLQDGKQVPDSHPSGIRESTEGLLNLFNTNINEVKNIKAILAQITVEGDRYPEELEKRTGLRHAAG